MPRQTSPLRGTKNQSWKLSVGTHYIAGTSAYLDRKGKMYNGLKQGRSTASVERQEQKLVVTGGLVRQLLSTSRHREEITVYETLRLEGGCRAGGQRWKMREADRVPDVTFAISRNNCAAAVLIIPSKHGA